MLLLSFPRPFFHISLLLVCSRAADKKIEDKKINKVKSWHYLMTAD